MLRSSLFLLTLLAVSFGAEAREPDYKALGNALGMAKFINEELCSKFDNELTQEVIDRLEAAQVKQTALKRALSNAVYTKQGRDSMIAALKKVTKGTGVKPEQLYNDEDFCYQVDFDVMADAVMLLEFQGF